MIFTKLNIPVFSGIMTGYIIRWLYSGIESCYQLPLVQSKVSANNVNIYLFTFLPVSPICVLILLACCHVLHFIAHCPHQSVPTFYTVPITPLPPWIIIDKLYGTVAEPIHMFVASHEYFLKLVFVFSNQRTSPSMWYLKSTTLSS